MRLSIARVLEHDPHVDVVAFEEVDLPLRAVLEGGLHPFPEHRLAERHLPWRHRRRGGRPPRRSPRPPTLRLLDRQHKVHVRGGFLLYRSRVAVADLLLQRWLEDGGQDPISATLRHIRTTHGDPVDQAAAVEAFLRGIEDRGEPSWEAATLVPAEELDWHPREWRRLAEVEGRAYAWIPHEPLLLAVDHPERLAGRPVVRRELLLSQPDDLVLHFDGRRLRSWAGPSDVDPSILARFDAEGFVLPDTPGATLPVHEVAPRFLLVVPDAPDMQHPGESPAGLGPAWVGEPWRVPACFSDAGIHRLPVLEGRDAAAVLARTTDGLFLPGVAPRRTPLRGALTPGALLIGGLPSARQARAGAA